MKKTWDVSLYSVVYENGRYLADGTQKSFYFENENEAAEKYEELKKDLIIDYKNGENKDVGVSISTFEDDYQVDDDGYNYGDFESDYDGGYESLDSYQISQRVNAIVEKIADDRGIEKDFYGDCYCREITNIMNSIEFTYSKNEHKDLFDEIESILESYADAYENDEE